MKKLLLTLISFLFILTSYSQYTDDGYYYEADTIEENTTIVNNYYEYEIISYSDRINRFYYYDYWYYYPPTINWFYMDFWYYDYYFNFWRTPRYYYSWYYSPYYYNNWHYSPYYYNWYYTPYSYSYYAGYYNNTNRTNSKFSHRNSIGSAIPRTNQNTFGQRIATQQNEVNRIRTQDQQRVVQNESTRTRPQPQGQKYERPKRPVDVNGNEMPVKYRAPQQERSPNNYNAPRTAPQRQTASPARRPAQPRQSTTPARTQPQPRQNVQPRRSAPSRAPSVAPSRNIPRSSPAPSRSAPSRNSGSRR